MRPRRRGRALLLGLGALALVAAVAFVAWRLAASARELHVVNGYAAPLTLELGEREPLTLAPGERATVSLPAGRHRLRASGAVTLDEELELAGASPTTLFDERLYVLNPGGEAVLLRETATYAGSALEAGAPPELEPVFGELLSELEPVDHPFEPFPDQVENAGGEETRRSRLDLFRGEVAQLVGRLAELGAGDEALELAEWALDRRPAERTALLAAYAAAALDAGAIERARSFLRPGLARRPLDVDLHKSYQRLARSPEEQAQLVAEYDALVDASPDEAGLLYLRGRLEGRSADAAEWFERAAERDPTDPWAVFSLACCRASEGDWAAAADAARAACASPEGAARFRGFLDLARFSAGERAALEAELVERQRANPGDLAVWVMLGLVRTAEGRHEEARELAGALERTLSQAGVPPAQVAGAVQSLELDLLQARGELERALPLAPDAARRGRILLGLERIDEAEELLGYGDDAYAMLALAVARELAGDPERAAAWRAKAAALLAEGEVASRLVARALEGGEPGALDDAVGTYLQPDHKALALAALADLHPDRAAELHALALELHVLPVFPRGLLERAAAGD